MADTPPPPHVTVILPPQTSAQTATNFIMTNDAYISRPGSTINGYVNVFPFSSIPSGDTQSNEEDNSDDAIPPPKADFSAPPPYEVVTSSKLPSYEEVQREKRIHGEEDTHMGLPPVNQAPPFAYLTVEPTESTIDINDPESNLLGTDFMFFTAFFVAFMFNWIGFLLLMCFCHTIASRYGALSGFGLSLAKWTLIVKHSTELASHENSWLWWLIMAFGVLICIRAIVQYLNIKRGWRLLSGTAQERLLFFY